MSIPMDAVGGVIFTGLGLWFAIRHKSLGTYAAYHQKRFMNSIKIHVRFSDQTVFGMQIGFLVVGLTFILLGLFFLSRAIWFK
jgi:hypothetical protein